jgi:F-type H+-transporting ATPase subunit b
VLLAGLALATIVALSSGAAAGAQEGEGEEELTHESEECIELLEEGKDVDACQEAPSPILPPLNELIWGSISFVLVFLLLRKLAWPGIKKGMEGRTERIRADLAQAESVKTEAEQVLAEYRSQLADARSESGRIIEEARQTADSMRRDLAAQAESDIAEMRRKAAADIEAAKAQAIADLRGEVASLAIGAAERVVEHSLDRETNTALVESFISQVGADR